MVNSTADINAVSRTDKFGHSMPILKSVPGKSTEGFKHYDVYHEGEHHGILLKNDAGKWWSRNLRTNGPWNGPHTDRHSAVAEMFSSIDPATYGERHRPKSNSSGYGTTHGEGESF